MLLAWCNFRGAFESLQSGRRQTAVLALAWATFLISLALPSITVFGPVLGISAAWFSIAGPIESMFQYGQPAFGVGVIIYLVIDVANLLMLLLPLLVWRLHRGRGRHFGAALCIVMPASWCVAWDPVNLLLGYYVWCVSFGIALLAIRIRMPVLIAMLGVATTLAAIVLHEK